MSNRTAAAATTTTTLLLSLDTMADDSRSQETERDPATLGTVSIDPNNEHVACVALKHVVKEQLFPNQKFLHPQDLVYSDNQYSLAQLVRTWINGSKSCTQAWWARTAPLVAGFVTKQRNTKCTAVKNNFMSKLMGVVR